MFLTHKPTSDAVEILDTRSLADPFQNKVVGRFHSGEEMQEATYFKKAELLFPSGEPLPQCWIDGHYRDQRR